MMTTIKTVILFLFWIPMACAFGPDQAIAQAEASSDDGLDETGSDEGVPPAPAASDGGHPPSGTSSGGEMPGWTTLGSDEGDASTSGADDEWSTDDGSGGEWTTWGDDGSESSTGAGACTSNLECDAESVCADGECVDAWDADYVVRVVSFSEPCDNAGSNSFYAQVGAVQTSTTGCPIGWPGDDLPFAGDEPLLVEFYEEGFPVPYQISIWCWGELECQLVPKDVLHNGAAVVDWNNVWMAAFEIEVQ